MKKIGFYSGTFDPVHVGHIEFALAAIKQHGLDRVVLLPERTPREKTVFTPFEHRLQMLELAIQDYTDVLSVMVLLEDQFTVQKTLPVLQDAFKNDQLVYLCGSDVVSTFTYRWEGLTDLLRTVEVIVGLRKQDTKQSVDAIFASIQKEEGVHSMYAVIKSPKIHLASTQVRAGMHTIEDIDSTVADYISAHGLYISG